MRTFIFLFLFSQTLFAVVPSGNKNDNFSLIHLETPSTAVIKGCVNSITGEYFRATTDIQIAGTEPLNLERYLSDKLYFDYGEHTWSFFGFNVASALDMTYKTALREANGGIVYLEKGGRLGNGHQKFRLQSDHVKVGVTNFSGDLLGRNNHLRYLKVETNKNADKGFVKYPNGTKRYYKKFKDKTLKRDFLFPSKEVMPSGAYHEYQYISDYGISQVTLKARNGDPLAFLKFTYPGKKQLKNNPYFDVLASNGQSIRYHLEKHKRGVQFKINKVEKSHAPNEHIKFYYTKNDHLERIRVRKPQCRYRDTILYHYGKQKTRKGIKNITKSGSDIGTEMLVGRVHQLRAPVGNDDTPVVTHNFEYWTVMSRHVQTGEEKIVRGHTTVYDAHDYKTCYHFNENFQLSKIEKFEGSQEKNYRIYSTEHFRYDSKGQLTQRFFEKAGEGILFCRVFAYNVHGNVVSDQLWGNLTGKEDVKTVQRVAGSPIQNGVDVYTKNYKYSNDTFHNLTYESDGIQETYYAYLESSNILTEKLTGSIGRIQAREFYQYNPRGELITKIADDGESRDVKDLTGVTCRKIERREYTSSFPTKVEVFFLDPESGREQLQSRICTRYSVTGKPLEEQYYDSEGVLLYTLRKEYDLHDNIILATDPLGIVTTYSYDANDNLIAQEREGIQKRNTFDFADRLIKEEIYGPDAYQSLSSRYNHLNQKTAQINTWGNKTRFDYDAFGRPTVEYAPSFLGADQSVVTPVIRRSYDAFGNVTKLVTASGYEMFSAYNIKGDLIRSWDAEGTLERCEYSPNGWLIKKTERSGIQTRYSHDFMGRVVEESIYDAAGQFVRSARVTYKGPFKISEIDSTGVETSYSYDYKGQCVSKTTAGAVTYFTYDTLGRVVSEQIEDSIKTVAYDYFDRVVEETHDGRIARKVYDAHGRVVEEQHGDVITRTQYNAIGLPVKITDGEGRVTVIAYNDDFINSLGQRVRLVIQTNPNGTQSETEFNSLGQIARQSTRSSFGDLLQESVNFYDANNKLCETIARVIAQNKAPYDRKISYFYDPQGRLIALKDGAGSPEQKTTLYFYNTLGQKVSEVQANGIAVDNTYDLLGRVSTLTTSDSSVSYSYAYDNFDRLIFVQDNINGTSTVKEYDLLGQMVSEKLANELTVQYSYDIAGRLIEMKLPEELGSIVSYAYKGIAIDTVSYEGCTHRYLERDLGGKPIIEMLANDVVRNTTYAPTGQKMSIQSAGFNDKVLMRDVSGNVLQRQLQNREQSYRWDELHQLTGENSRNYIHDSVYNRTHVDGNDYTLNMLNQVVSDGENPYSYDLNGNLTTGRGVTLTYDGLNRLVAVTTDKGTAQYTYDAENRRMTTVKDGETTRYCYSGMNELGSASSTATAMRVFGESEGAERGAGVLLVIDGVKYVPLYDLVGNIVQLQDVAGGVVEEYRIDLFGVEEFTGEEAPLSPWRYSSKRVDGETGFVYFGHRYYDPALGRWATADPQGYAAGPNLYAYVMNNPVAHMDQYGFVAERSVDRGCERSGRNSGKAARIGKNRYLLGAIRLCVTTPQAKESADTTTPPKCGEVRTGQLEVVNAELNLYCYNVGNKPDNGFISFMNGLNNTLEDATRRAAFFSEIHGGVNVYLVYNPTRGILRDILGAVGKIFNFETQTCVNARKAFNLLLDMHPGQNAIFYSHSEGSLVSKNVFRTLSDEKAKRIVSVAIGGAAIIEPEGLGGAINIISKRDAIPFTCSALPILSHILWEKKPHIQLINGRGFYGLDHAASGRTYQKALKRYAEKIEQELK